MRVLVLGGGSIGERHARCFLATGRCDVSVVDLREEVCRRLASTYPLARTWTQPELALSETWDAVVVATPAHLHVPQALAALNLGAAVLIEKPLTTRLSEVATLRELAARTGKPVGVAYVFRAHPAVQAVREAIQSGDIGTLLHLTVVAGQHFPTFRPEYRSLYYARRATGGGAIQDTVTHEADLVHLLAGRFRWVLADYARQHLEGVEVEDTVNLLGRLENGCLVSLALNQFQAPNEVTLTIHGSEGSLRLELHTHRWGRLRRGDSDWEFSPTLVHGRDELFVRQANTFLDAVEGRGPVSCGLGEAEEVLRFGLAALLSGAGGTRIEPNSVPLDLDPAAFAETSWVS